MIIHQGELLLNDRWFNPPIQQPITSRRLPFHLAKQLNIKDDKEHILKVVWDTHAGRPKADVFVDGRKQMSIPLTNASLHGISYVHFLSSDRPGDKGYSIQWVEAKKN